MIQGSFNKKRTVAPLPHCAWGAGSLRLPDAVGLAAPRVTRGVESLGPEVGDLGCPYVGSGDWKMPLQGRIGFLG